MIAEGGLWMYPTLVIGITSALTALVHLGIRSPQLASLSKHFAFASLCLGLAGTTMGLYQAGKAMAMLDAEVATCSMMMNAVGVACTTTFVGAALASLSALLLGIGAALKAPESLKLPSESGDLS